LKQHFSLVQLIVGFIFIFKSNMESFILDAAQVPKSILHVIQILPYWYISSLYQLCKKTFEGWFKKFSCLKFQSYVILDVTQLSGNFDFIKIIENNDIKIFISTLCYDNVLDCDFFHCKCIWAKCFFLII